MAVTYTTAAEVASRCNFLSANGDARAVFGTDPLIPNQAEVEDIINLAEEYIEKITQQAWGTRVLQVTNELHDIWWDREETAFHFNFANVKDLESGTDKIEVWGGASWTDWVATKTEGRGDDFFVDYNIGKVYFLSNPIRWSRYGKLTIRATYRVNAGATVPKPISFATAFMTGIIILNSEYASISFPSGEGEELTKEDMMNRWWFLIRKLLSPYTVGEVPVEMPFSPISY